jgi:hypothetical protein
VQGQDADSFVRIGSGGGDTATATRPDAAGHDTPMPKRRRRHRRFHLSPLTVVGLVLLGWLAWAATTPGGVQARIEGISDRLQGAVDDATTNSGLHKASEYFNDRYEAAGAYPDLSEEELREDPSAEFGFGVDVKWCGAHAIVLQSMSGRGTISRLLLSGEDLGDVSGAQQCPTDLTVPAPWTVPGS